MGNKVNSMCMKTLLPLHGIVFIFVCISLVIPQLSEFFFQVSTFVLNANRTVKTKDVH